MDSDNLISTLFPLVAANSSGVAVSAQKTHMLGEVGCLKVSPVRSPPGQSVLH